ncbi:MAG TPA: porin family protein [Ramlibacter sp.]|nr:porin family protein [Ramlibacter sp.]
MKKILLALATGAVALGAAPAQAQLSQLIQRPYVGIGISANDRVTHLPNTFGATDDWKPQPRVFAGLEFDDMFGVEIGYTSFRENHINFAINNVQGHLTAWAESAYLAGKASAPLNEQFSIYGKLGVSRNKWKQAGVGPGRLFREDNDTEAYMAVGSEWRFTDRMGLSLEFERYGSSKAFGPKPNVWSINANYRF